LIGWLLLKLLSSRAAPIYSEQTAPPQVVIHVHLVVPVKDPPSPTMGL
jgi:hypothetical protein